MSIHKNDGENDGDDSFKDGIEKEIMKGFRAAMAGNNKRQKVAQEIGMKSASDGHADVAEAMHILYDEINRSPDLNIAAMLPLTKTFQAVFGAFLAEADAQVIHNDSERRFLMECGIVNDDEGCFHCAPGGVHLHDLQIVAGISAMRFFVFARLRKIESALPIIRGMMDEGSLEQAATNLNEAMNSASSMMEMMHKLGFSLLGNHPVAIKAQEGAAQAAVLMQEIQQRIAKRNAGQ